MKSQKLILASFDPITLSEVDEIKRILKDEHLLSVDVYPKEEGILPFHIRLALLKKAMAPYHKIHVKPIQSQSILSLESEKDEALVREGNFYQAAKGIQKELIKEGYYLDEVVNTMCNEKRAKHTRSVAKLCVELAKVHQLDEKKAWIMGMLHDITKNLPKEYHESILKLYEPNKLELNPNVWHSYTAKYWIKQHLGNYDQQILSAIDHHTIGDGKSDYARILYIADKCDDTRGYDSSREIELSKKDLKAGAHLVLQEAKAYILEKEGIDV